MRNRRWLVGLVVILAALACGPLGAPSAQPLPQGTPAPSPSPTATFFSTPPTFTPYPTITPGPSPTPIPSTPLPTEFFVEPSQQSSRDLVIQLSRGEIEAADFSIDGHYIAIGTAFGIYLYNAVSFEEIWFLPTNKPVDEVAISPDNQQIAYITRGDALYFVPLDFPNRTQPWLTTVGERYNRLRWSPNGKLIAVGMPSGKQLLILDPSTGRQVYTFNQVSLIFWGPGADSFTINSPSGAQVIDLQTGAARYSIPDGSVPMALSPNGRQILRVAGGPEAEYFTIQDIQATSPSLQLRAGAEWISPVSAAWSPDGTLVTVGQGVWEGAVLPTTVWDVRTGQRLFEQSSGAFESAFSPDSQVLFTASPDAVIAWDAHSGQVLRRIEGFKAWYNHITTAVWSPDGHMLALGAENGDVTLWDMTGREVLDTIKTHQSTVADLQWSEGGHKLIINDSEYGEHDSYIYDMTERKVIAHITAPDLFPLAWPPDDSSIYATEAVEVKGSSEPPVFHMQMHDLASDRILWAMDSASAPEIFWSPDGTEMLTREAQALVRRSPKTGAVFGRLASPGYDNRIISIFPDGRRLLMLTKANQVAIWDMRAGQILQDFQAAGITRTPNQAYIYPAASPDGTMVAIVDDNRTIHIVDVATGARLKEFDDAHRAYITSLIWSPDGTMLLSAGDDSVVRIWNVRQPQ